MSCAIVFGGAGFIGGFFARYLLERGVVDKVYLFDSEQLVHKKSDFRRQFLNTAGVEVVTGDVRSIITWQPAETVSLIANFAAVHREQIGRAHV